MRGITFSTYMIITTLLGPGHGPVFRGHRHPTGTAAIWGRAIISINAVVPVIVILLLIVLMRYQAVTRQHDAWNGPSAGGEDI